MKVRFHIGRGFQFHKGTIKTTYRYVRAGKLFNFNSIKVRLKRKERALAF